MSLLWMLLHTLTNLILQQYSEGNTQTIIIPIL